MTARNESVTPSGITSIGVQGYKSLRDPQEISITPLTVLAGVNSSGKSSIIQPLLLLKQTLEAPFDPGPLLLDGPNVSVTKIEQILSRGVDPGTDSAFFSLNVAIGGAEPVTLRFARQDPGGIHLDITLRIGGQLVMLDEYMTEDALVRQLPRITNEMRDGWKIIGDWKILRDRWSLNVRAEVVSQDQTLSLSLISETPALEREIAQIIHLPALRGNPRRTYRTAAIEERFPGVFNDYTAGVISAWQNRKVSDKLRQLSTNLERLGLTSAVQARQLDDAAVELVVNRLPGQSHHDDLVNIADVGFGVSQTLPVVVALLVAAPGQLVYLEQPEIHLHPRAQTRFADLLADAVDRGVRVVVETHSSLLLRAIQTLVARQRIDVADVVLHWFGRDPQTGYTSIASTQLDRSGAFGEWPEDFDEVSLATEHAYLTAAEEAEGLPE